MDVDELIAVRSPEHAFAVVRVRMLGHDERGRRGSVRAGYGGYRPQLWFGLRDMKQQRLFNDAVWIAMDGDELLPGDSTRIVIEPLTPEVVGVLWPGVWVEFYEGHRKVGEGVVEQQLPRLHRD